MNDQTAVLNISPRLRPARSSAATHLWLAALLTFVLALGWGISGWNALRLLRLPDNDDMMRLAQVRDWLGGQPFNDLSQHRLGPPWGASMHWSRIADAIPALMILVLTPLIGQHHAELAMAFGYPALMFFTYLLLLGHLANRLAPGSGIVAILLGAVAFPTISLFIPGRIDHHCLQIVLSTALVCGMVAPAGWRSGLWNGTMVALSLAIGLETAPEIVAVLAGLGILWIIGDRAENRRMLGFAVAGGAITLLHLVVARPWIWPEQWCDGFTPNSSRATLVLAAALGAVGIAGLRLRTVRTRLVAASLIGGLAAAAAILVAPVCFGGPYNALTPFLKTVWMSNVSEAKDLFFGQDTIGTSVAFGALAFVGFGAAAARLVRDGRTASREWVVFTLFLGLCLVAAILQVRVTYVLAGIATVPMAVAIHRSRTRGGALMPRLLLWITGAGITFNLAAHQLDALLAKPIEAARMAARACTQGEPILVPARATPGTVAAPIDLGSYLIGMTPHHVLAAGYHRNNDGNMAAYRFFLSSPEDARAMARAWGIDYVALCPENMREPELMDLRRGSLIESLQGQGAAPSWLTPVPTGGTLRFYRVIGGN